MKTASRVLQKELTVPMLNILDGITDFRAFIIDAMEEYAEQARKDERLKVLEEMKDQGPLFISPYNLFHNELDSSCCGAFDVLDKDGLIKCNECSIYLKDLNLSIITNLSKNHALIMEILTAYLSRFPEIRFGQALFNLGINQFADPVNPERGDYKLREIYYDLDGRILERMKSKLEK